MGDSRTVNAALQDQAEPYIYAVVERHGRALDDGHYLPVYHLIEGEWDEAAEFQPVRCGGGMPFPFRERVLVGQVCPDCASGVRTMDPAVASST